MSSKREVSIVTWLILLTLSSQIYRFLTAEVRAYVSSIESMTIYHLRDLASGKRRIINCEVVKVFMVPHYENLTIEKMLRFADAWPKVAEHLPLEPREVEKLPRAYIANVIYTIVGKPFAEWVEAGISARNAKVQEKYDMMVDLDPEIAKIFANSSAISGK